MNLPVIVLKGLVLLPNNEIRLEIYALFYRIKTYESRWRKIILGEDGERENG